ncbi:MAG: hypothetical protein ACRD2L_19135 [Terriglobia bacterium]
MATKKDTTPFGEARTIGGEMTMASSGVRELKPGDKLSLFVREPQDYKNARADYDGNYQITRYVGEVEKANLTGTPPRIDVRWHLPKALGYDTVKGSVSTMVHVADSAWVEARKKPRNVVAKIDRIPEEEYKKLLEEAAGQP